MEVKHDFSYPTCGFAIDLRAPDSAKTFTYKTYVRSIEEDILYENPVNVIVTYSSYSYANFRTPSLGKDLRMTSAFSALRLPCHNRFHRRTNICFNAFSVAIV